MDEKLTPFSLAQNGTSVSPVAKLPYDWQQQVRVPTDMDNRFVAYTSNTGTQTGTLLETDDVDSDP